MLTMSACAYLWHDILNEWKLSTYLLVTMAYCEIEKDFSQLGDCLHNNGNGLTIKSTRVIAVLTN